MQFNRNRAIISFLKANEGQKFTSREIAAWLVKTYPEEVKRKAENSKCKSILNVTDPAKIAQIIIVLFSGEMTKERNEAIQKQEPGIKITQECPRKYYFTKKTDQAEIEEAEKLSNQLSNYVKKDKAIKFDWSTSGAVSSPRRYRVMYRIDPRFNRPQIFIKTFNYLTKKYEATNFPKFKATDPTKDYISLAFSKMQNYVDYFNFAENRQKIRVEKGDVINITLTGAGDFFSVATDEDFLKSELDNNILGVPSLYTNSNLDNKILYSTAEKLCDSIDPSSRDKVCQDTGANTKYKVLDKLALVGKPFRTQLERN